MDKNRVRNTIHNHYIFYILLDLYFYFCTNPSCQNTLCLTAYVTSVFMISYE